MEGVFNSLLKRIDDLLTTESNSTFVKQNCFKSPLQILSKSNITFKADQNLLDIIWFNNHVQ